MTGDSSDALTDLTNRIIRKMLNIRKEKKIPNALLQKSLIKLSILVYDQYKGIIQLLLLLVDKELERSRSLCR